VRGTHVLESAEGWISQDVEKERRELKSWGAHRNRQVRTWKGRERARGTHGLESIEGRTSEDIERK
jgi:hypothetical protein